MCCLRALRKQTVLPDHTFLLGFIGPARLLLVPFLPPALFFPAGATFSSGMGVRCLTSGDRSPWASLGYARSESGGELRKNHLLGHQPTTWPLSSYGAQGGPADPVSHPHHEQWYLPPRKKCPRVAPALISTVLQPARVSAFRSALALPIPSL